MEFPQAVSAVMQSDAFNADDGYLVHGFFSEEKWQIGFYDEDNDTITPYTVNNTVTRGTPEEVFKKEGAVPSLAVEDVLLTKQQAIDTATKALEKDHPGHPVTKHILLVQTIKGVAAYNLTLVTATLHMFNCKIDASTGNVLSSVFDSIMALKAD